MFLCLKWCLPYCKQPVSESNFDYHYHPCHFFINHTRVSVYCSGTFWDTRVPLVFCFPSCTLLTMYDIFHMENHSFHWEKRWPRECHVLWVQSLGFWVRELMRFKEGWRLSMEHVFNGYLSFARYSQARSRLQIHALLRRYCFSSASGRGGGGDEGRTWHTCFVLLAVSLARELRPVTSPINEHQFPSMLEEIGITPWSVVGGFNEEPYRTFPGIMSGPV